MKETKMKKTREKKQQTTTYMNGLADWALFHKQMGKAERQGSMGPIPSKAMCFCIQNEKKQQKQHTYAEI